MESEHLRLAKALIDKLSADDTVALLQHIEQRLAQPTTPTSGQMLSAPIRGLVIDFCESSAAAFPRALAFARAAPSYHSRQEGKRTWHTAIWPDADFSSATQLADALSGLRNKRVILDGQELDWSAAFSFVYCAQQRAQAYRPSLHCFGEGQNRLNPWGCIHARLDWAEWGDWFSHGQFKQVASGFFGGTKTVWFFDKERIRHELEVNLYKVRFCPHLNLELANAVLAALPESVEIKANGKWQYNRNYEERPGSIKITETTERDGYKLTDDYYADGVQPRGLEPLREILTEALAKARVKGVTAAQILKIDPS